MSIYTSADLGGVIAVAGSRGGPCSAGGGVVDGGGVAEERAESSEEDEQRGRRACRHFRWVAGGMVGCYGAGCIYSGLASG